MDVCGISSLKAVCQWQGGGGGLVGSGGKGTLSYHFPAPTPPTIPDEWHSRAIVYTCGFGEIIPIGWLNMTFVAVRRFSPYISA